MEEGMLAVLTMPASLAAAAFEWGKTPEGAGPVLGTLAGAACLMALRGFGILSRKPAPPRRAAFVPVLSRALLGATVRAGSAPPALWALLFGAGPLLSWIAVMGAALLSSPEGVAAGIWLGLACRLACGAALFVHGKKTAGRLLLWMLFAAVLAEYAGIAVRISLVPGMHASAVFAYCVFCLVFWAGECVAAAGAGVREEGETRERPGKSRA